MVQTALCLLLPDKAQVHPSCLLCLTSHGFLSFFSQSAILHSSTLGPLNECRRTERPPPHLTPRHTSNTRTCLLLGGRAKLLHRRIDRAYLDFRCSQRTAVRGHGAYWYPYVVSTYLGGGVQADTVRVLLVWRGVEGGGSVSYTHLTLPTKA